MAIKVRKRAHASWSGDVPHGTGRIAVHSGALDAPYSLRSREHNAKAHTNPEELIGAALAGCFAMSLANLLSESGHPPKEVTAKATVHLEQLESGGFSITRIDLEAGGQVDGVDEETFRALATHAEETCPVSRALAGTSVVLSAGLEAPSRA